MSDETAREMCYELQTIVGDLKKRFSELEKKLDKHLKRWGCHELG